MALWSLGGIVEVYWAFWGYGNSVASEGHSGNEVCCGDPRIHHSPQLIHLILQRLRFLGQAGQRLVPLLQLSDLPLQLDTAQTIVLPATL